MEQSNDGTCLERVHKHSIDVIKKQSKPVLPTQTALQTARSILLEKLPEEGLGIEKTTDSLLEDIGPALNGSSLSPNYYGFVTGGITPAARVAERIVSLYDQNVQVHLPGQTVATNVEDKALRLLLELLQFDAGAWTGTFTTGATASNVLGLACGREHIINARLRTESAQSMNEAVGSLGIIQACRLAGIDQIHVYTTMAHSSLFKASSILGIGRACVEDIRSSESKICFNIALLEEKLASRSPSGAAIVVISCAEVNTGLFATTGSIDLHRLRSLCDTYSAWLHVDGGRFQSLAFVPTSEPLILHSIWHIWQSSAGIARI